MTRVYYRDSHGAIVVYDCKRSDTLAGAYRWKKDLDSKLILDNGQPIPAILVANKSDLENTITGQMLDEYARQGGFKAGFKLSAKTGEGIEPAMDFLLRNVVCAEREGLYLMPMLQRDQNLHRLSLQELEQKKGRGGVSKKRFFQNTCC
ncbi:Ras [Globodera pallida]|nr:Ras [Globodera pallida]